MLTNMCIKIVYINDTITSNHKHYCSANTFILAADNYNKTGIFCKLNSGINFKYIKYRQNYYCADSYL